jgi:DNA-binding response OmpR family regulator
VEKSKGFSLRARPKITSKKKTILVVDDSNDLLELQRVILEMDGFEVFTALSGRAALKILREIDSPELVLLDVQMGDMTGSDFLKVLEEKNPEIATRVPIVFLTGMDQIPKGNVLGFIRKPFEMNQFLEAVHGFIDLGRHSPCYH